MSRESNSQCQMMQLHIDQCLDGELESGRRLEFDRHLSACEACRAEFAYAQKLHLAVVALPRLDCADTSLEPVQRMLNLSSAGRRNPDLHWWDALRKAFSIAPVYVRYAIPVLALALLVGTFNSRQILTPEVLSTTASVSSQVVPEITTPPQYSQEEILQAMADLDLALDYLESVGERAGILVRDRFVLQQLEDSINASLRTRDGQPRFDQDGRSDGPI